MDSYLRIRPVSPGDAEELLAIYAPYVETTAITFEYEVPSPAEFAERIRRTEERYPYLAAEADGRLLGYAYAGAFVGRAAYDWSCELTIYLARDARKMRLGRQLYTALEQRLAQMGVLNLYACIGWPEAEDEYLTRNSAQFHEHLGFTLEQRLEPVDPLGWGAQPRQSPLQSPLLVVLEPLGRRRQVRPVEEALELGVVPSRAGRHRQP